MSILNNSHCNISWQGEHRNMSAGDLEDISMWLGDEFQAFIELLRCIFADQSHITFSTSGSTGEPKAIDIPKRLLQASAERSINEFGLTEKTKSLLCLPADKIGGAMVVLRTLLSGGTLYLTTPSSKPLIPGMDVTSIVPYQLYQILDDPEQRTLLDTYHTILIGGAPIEKRLPDLSLSKVRLYHTYGMTETGSHVAICRLPTDNWIYELMKGFNMDQSPEGCIKLYSDETGWIQTNDVVEIIDEKSFRWLGRADNVINSGGIKIFPELLEKQVELSVSSWLFCGVQDDEFGQKLVLVVEGHVQYPADLLQSAARQIENPYARPKLVYAVDAFPRTKNGKIKRSDLTRQLDQLSPCV